MITYYIIPIFFTLILVLGIKKNNYQSFISGAKKGISIALDALPYILAMMLVTRLLSSSVILIYITENMKIPSLYLLLGIFRPLSSTASLTFLLQIYQTFGVDSELAIAASILQASTDASIYICSFYYGYVKIKKYNFSLFLGVVCNLLTFIITLILLTYFL